MKKNNNLKSNLIIYCLKFKLIDIKQFHNIVKIHKKLFKIIIKILTKI
jgi:hypothetical protein